MRPGRLPSSIIANLVYLAVRAPWVRPLGDLVTTGIGVAALSGMLRVFPFAFDTGADWASSCASR